jgi:hypothetical protein
MLSKLYKILGQLKDKDGAGVVGHNTAESGDAIGVECATESDEGYGLYTEDDARVGGEMSSSSLSTDELTNIYDFVISPSDDLQDIISNQASKGDSIWIGPGQHDTDGRTDITVDNLTIDGAGASSLVKGAGGHVVFAVFNEADKVTIKNIRVDQNADDPTTGTSPSDGTAIRWRGAQGGGDYGTVKNVVIENCDYDGLLAGKNALGFTVENVLVSDVGDDGINPGGPTLDAGDDPPETTVSNCVVERANNDSYHLSTASERTVLSACRSKFAGRAGIGVNGGDNIIVDGFVSYQDQRGVQSFNSPTTINDVDIGATIIEPTNRGVIIEHDDASNWDLDLHVVDAAASSVRVRDFGGDITLDLHSENPGSGRHVLVLSNEDVSPNQVQLSGRLVGGDRGVIDREGAAWSIDDLNLNDISEYGILLSYSSETAVDGRIDGVTAVGGITDDIIFLNDATGVAVNGLVSSATSANNAVNESGNADKNLVDGCVVDAPINVSGTNSEEGTNIVK